MDKIKFSIHSDDENFSTAARKYWLVDEADKFVYFTGDIAEELGIPVQTLTSLIRQYTAAMATDKQCSACGRYYPLTSRTSFSERKPSKTWTCSDCLASEKQQIVEAKLKAEQIQRDEIIKAWEPQNRAARPTEEYSLMDAVVMLGMIRGGAAEDYSYIKPVDYFDDPLTPHKEFTSDVLNYVFNRALLTPHPGSSISAFEFTEGEPKSFYLYKVHWVMPERRSLRETASTLESIIAEGLPPKWQASVPGVWQEIVLQEGLELLQHYAAEHHFRLQVGEKTVDVLTTILKHYSVAQLQNFLWRAARDAAAYYVREGVPQARAANSIITRLQGSYERARADDWEIKPFGRLFSIPQSLVSTVFFNFIMQMPDSYRTSLPPDSVISQAP